MIDFSDYPDLCEAGEIGDGSFGTPLVAAACDIVREACGWHIAPQVERAVTIDSPGSGLLSLPSMHIVDIDSVVDTVDQRAIDGWEFSEFGVLELANGARWPKGRRRIRVTMTHGLVAAPAGIRAVIAEIADGLDPAKIAASNYRQVSLDGASLSFWKAAGISQDPKKAYGHVLNRYSL